MHKTLTDRLDHGDALNGDVVNVVLAFLRAPNVLLRTALLISSRRC